MQNLIYMWWIKNYNIHLGHITGLLQHQGAIVRFMWPSKSWIITLTMGHWLCNKVINLGCFTVGGAIAIAQGQYIGIGTFIWDLYQVWCNTMDQWLGSHDHQHHASTPEYGLWLYKNLTSMWWIKLCGGIDIAQGQYNGVWISICDLNQVCCNTREQWWAHMTPNTMHIPLT